MVSHLRCGACRALQIEIPVLTLAWHPIGLLSEATSRRKCPRDCHLLCLIQASWTYLTAALRHCRHAWKSHRSALSNYLLTLLLFALPCHDALGAGWGRSFHLENITSVLLLLLLLLLLFKVLLGGEGVGSQTQWLLTLLTMARAGTILLSIACCVLSWVVWEISCRYWVDRRHWSWSWRTCLR